YKVAKQADAVMLFYLFSSEELQRLVGRLGYEDGPDTVSNNVAYYDRRTSHGWTLSHVAYAGGLAALNSDVGDVQGGTTKEGIHVGVMAGTLDLVQRSYMGTQVRDGVLRFDPRLPAPIDGVAFSMQFRRTPLLVRLADGRLTIAAHPEGVNRPIKVGVGDQVRDFGPGDRYTFELQPARNVEQQLT